MCTVVIANVVVFVVANMCLVDLDLDQENPVLVLMIVAAIPALVEVGVELGVEVGVLPVYLRFSSPILPPALDAVGLWFSN